MMIKIRFNTETLKNTAENLPEWRVLIGGTEYSARDIRIECASWTTKDEIEPGVWKWHITCDGVPEWNTEKTKLKISPL